MIHLFLKFKNTKCFNSQRIKRILLTWLAQNLSCFSIVRSLFPHADKIRNNYVKTKTSTKTGIKVFLFICKVLSPIYWLILANFFSSERKNNKIKKIRIENKPVIKIVKIVSTFDMYKRSLTIVILPKHFLHIFMFRKNDCKTIAWANIKRFCIYNIIVSITSMMNHNVTSAKKKKNFWEHFFAVFRRKLRLIV